MRWLGALAVGMVMVGVILVAVLVVTVGMTRSVDAVSATAPPRSAVEPDVLVDYDPVRLTMGVGLAVMFLVTAAVLVRTTDWSTVGEASAPEIDDAEYADLDAMAAAFEAGEFERAVTRQGRGDRLS